MMNGGIYEPLDNSSGDVLPEAIDAARAIGAATTASLLEGLVDLIGLGPVDIRNQELRRQALDSIEGSPELEAMLSPASEWFECAERFIESNRDDFFV